MKELYIVGNGFDLFHGINTSYYNFREYLTIHNSALLENVEKFLTYEADNEKSTVWNKFEYNLRNLDEDSIAEECECYLFGYGDEEWKDRFHHDYQYCIYTVTSYLTSVLLNEFTNWIKTVDNDLNSINSKVKFNCNALFMTFNYTMVLEKVYEIYTENILHIHNSIDGTQELILGHNYTDIERLSDISSLSKIKTKSDIEELLAQRALAEDDIRYQDGSNILRTYYEKNYKNTKNIIKRNSEFFSSLSKIEKIYTIGHSVSEIDLDYFYEIKNRVGNEAKWNFTWHTEDDMINIMNFVCSANIEQFHLRKISDYI